LKKLRKNFGDNSAGIFERLWPKIKKSLFAAFSLEKEVPA